jgi:hypothetical protein
MIDWTKLKLSKGEILRLRRIDSDRNDISFIVTENRLVAKPFTLYQVNPDYSLKKIRSDVHPMFKELEIK